LAVDKAGSNAAEMTSKRQGSLAAALKKHERKPVLNGRGRVRSRTDRQYPGYSRVRKDYRDLTADSEVVPAAPGKGLLQLDCSWIARAPLRVASFAFAVPRLRHGPRRGAATQRDD
jgi:hypothetical protein